MIAERSETDDRRYFDDMVGGRFERGPAMMLISEAAGAHQAISVTDFGSR